jgi:hypothetical protein
MMTYLLFVVLQARPDGAGGVQARQTAQARVPLARSLARDAAVVKAVQASNALREELAVIMKKDKAWANDPKLREEVLARPCSARLRELVAPDPFVVEALVMDERGALACATMATSDYWQGDEAKWQKTLQQGLPAFIDEPALDASTGVHAIQLSVPISEGERRIGAVTVTLKLRIGAGGVEAVKPASRPPGR